jgi:ribosomal protein L29
MDHLSRQIQIQNMTKLYDEIRNAMKSDDTATVDSKKKELHKLRLDLASSDSKKMLVILEDIKNAMKEGDTTALEAKKEEFAPFFI